MATSYQVLTDFDIQTVEESLKNTFEPFYKQAPIVRCSDYNSGVEDTTYKLAKLQTSLLDGGELKRWRYGTNPPEPDAIETGTVTITPEGTHSNPYTYAKNVSRQHLVKDLNNQAPDHLGKVYRSIDLALATALQSTTYWGSAVSFTGGSPLKAHGSDTNPIEDIDGAIRDNDLDDFQEMGLSLECWISRDVARILAAESDYSGGGSGSGVPAKLPMQQFLSMFKDIHGFDRVVLLGGAYNSAEEGATASVSGIATGVLWIGLIDRRKKSWDNTARPSAGINGGPDGAFAIALSEDPRIRLYESSTKGVQYTAGVAHYDVVLPRYAAEGNSASLSMGKFFDNILS